MRKKILLGVAVGAVFVLGSASGAFAGEVTGNGKDTGARGNANSICSFSGLDDGSEGGIGGPGNPPQNWGQIPKADRDAVSVTGAARVAFGPFEEGCNAHLYGLK